MQELSEYKNQIVSLMREDGAIFEGRITNIIVGESAESTMITINDHEYGHVNIFGNELGSIHILKP